jgi:two-component sensor histidine kinase
LVKSRTPLTVILLAAGFLALIIIVVATFWLSQRARQYASDVTHVRELRLSAVELKNALLTAESGQRGFLFSGNEIYLAPFDSAKAAARREASELAQDLVRYPQFLPMISQLGGLVDAKIAEMDETVAVKKSGDDEEALNLFLSNRGKALMDQTNVFVTGLVAGADTLLIEGVREQVRNADWLSWTSIAGGAVIVLVVAGAVNAFRQTTREIAAGRDEVRAINETLEKRVEDRTSALKTALERTELLLAEVNHRVANSLAMVGSLVRLQVRASKDPSVQAALTETQGRIAAIAAVHKRLYQSGDVGLVALDEYLSGLLEGLATTMRAEGHGGALTWELEKAKLGTDASINVGVVVTELVTNAYKYAYPKGDGDIRVSLRQLPASRIEIVVEDDGVGRGSGAAQGTGLGSRIVTSMAANLGTEVQYVDRNPGTAARLSVPAHHA